MELRFDVKGITEERFWEQAEDRILDALKDYAEQAENSRAVRRRMFAEDAARGFAFIDLCRKHYDAVLMNPPFGGPTRSTKEQLVAQYAGYGNDIFSV
jgi:predicted RNA methylase